MVLDTFGDSLKKIFSKVTGYPREEVLGNILEDNETQMHIIQLRSPVLWTENVRRMTREGVDTFIEVGPKRPFG